MNIKNELEKTVAASGKNIRLYDLEIDVDAIYAVMINEVVSKDPQQDFYSGTSADYMKTTIPLFHRASIPVSSMEEILSMGIYITNAVKIPKKEYAVEKSSKEKYCSCHSNIQNKKQRNLLRRY